MGYTSSVCVRYECVCKDGVSVDARLLFMCLIHVSKYVEVTQHLYAYTVVIDMTSRKVFCIFRVLMYACKDGISSTSLSTFISSFSQTPWLVVL